MKSEVSISIIMPVYNGADYLDACIASICAQTFTDWELIIVNDFSTDQSVEIIKHWVSTDVRIQLIHNLKKGIVPALSLAFEHSKGNYISRMDADDIMPNKKLAWFYEAASEGEKEVITGKVCYFSDEKISEGYQRYEHWLNGLKEDKDYKRFVYRECVVASPNWLVHRECFQNDFSFSELEYPEDYDMVFKWYQLNYKFICVDEVTHLWREHPKRTSRNVADYQQERFFELKTNYFIQFELKKDDKVQLIGSGKKGKLVAAILKQNGVAFTWFDIKTTHNKINNIPIISIDQLNKDKVTILTVWPRSQETQLQIKVFLKEKELFFGEHLWLF